MSNKNAYSYVDILGHIIYIIYHISYIIYLFARKFTRNSKCRRAVAELDGQGSKGALTVAYKIKMEYNMNKSNTKSRTY